MLSCVRMTTFALPLCCVLLPVVASAKELTVYVADKDSPAFAAASALANGTTIFVESKLFKGFSQVEALLQTCKDVDVPRLNNMPAPALNVPADELCVINVKVAGGVYGGKGGTGPLHLEVGYKPYTTVRILGGYDPTFKKRDPFTYGTFVSTPISVESKDHALGELYVSGFIIDVGGMNAYDKGANTLLKGSSSSGVCVAFGYLHTQRLVLADNVFLNSSHLAASPLIRSRSDDAEVLIRNNFVINNVHAWLADSARGKFMPKTYTFEGNSFLVNWPYNPDPTSGAVATVELKGSGSVHRFVVKDNIFAYNVGGALNTWATSDKNGPPIEIKNNLFYTNGALFGEPEGNAAAMVVKFGAFKSREITWNVINLEVLEDDYEWDAKGNVSMDPQIPIAFVKPGMANSNEVNAQNTVMNDVRGLFGLNKDGGTVKVTNFAPRIGVNLQEMPFPKNAAAQKYGVRRDRVEQF